MHESEKGYIGQFDHQFTQECCSQAYARRELHATQIKDTFEKTARGYAFKRPCDWYQLNSVMPKKCAILEKLKAVTPQSILKSLNWDRVR